MSILPSLIITIIAIDPEVLPPERQSQHVCSMELLSTLGIPGDQYGGHGGPLGSLV